VLNKQLPYVQFDAKRVYSSPLPSSFKYLLNDKSEVIEDCDSNYANATEAKTLRIKTIKFIDGQRTNDLYYVNVILNIAGTQVTINGNFTSPKDKVYLIDHIIEQFREKGVEVYWEKYAQFYKPESFIIPTFSLTDVYTITIDNEVAPVTDSTVSLTNVKTLTGKFIVPNRNTVNDLIENVLDSYYSRSRSTSPVSTIAYDFLHVYTDKKHLISKILIDYIRQPRPVSLSLNHGIELHESTHDRICDIAVEILKKQIEDNSLDKTVQYNQLRNT
jgi:hypothetical protein